MHAAAGHRKQYSLVPMQTPPSGEYRAHSWAFMVYDCRGSNSHVSQDVPCICVHYTRVLCPSHTIILYSQHIVLLLSYGIPGH